MASTSRPFPTYATGTRNKPPSSKISSGVCCFEPRADHRLRKLPVPAASAHRVEPVVAGELGTADHVREVVPLLGREDAEADPAVLATDDLRPVAAARHHRHRAGEVPVQRGVVEEAHRHHFECGDLDDRRPCPFAARCSHAASAASAPIAPAAHWPWPTPICSGGVSRVPHPDMSPHHAWSVNSSAGRPASGPSSPKAAIVTTLVSGPRRTAARIVSTDDDHVSVEREFGDAQRCRSRRPWPCPR